MDKPKTEEIEEIKKEVIRDCGCGFCVVFDGSAQAVAKVSTLFENTPEADRVERLKAASEEAGILIGCLIQKRKVEGRPNKISPFEVVLIAMHLQTMANDLDEKMGLDKATPQDFSVN